MGFAIDQNNGNGQNKNYMKNMIPGAHLSNSLYSDIPGKICSFFSWPILYYLINILCFIKY